MNEKPELIERAIRKWHNTVHTFASWAGIGPQSAAAVMLLTVVTLVLLLLAPYASALDQICDPSDPNYTPHVGDVYVSPAGTVHLCTSLDDPAGGRDIDETQPIHCLLTLDTTPYAMTDVAPGQEILLTIDADDLNAAHAADLTCTAFMVAMDGTTHERTSKSATFTFDPVPAPEAPVPLP